MVHFGHDVYLVYHRTIQEYLTLPQMFSLFFFFFYISTCKICLSCMSETFNINCECRQTRLVSFSVCFRVFYFVVVGLLVAWLAVDTRQNPEQLISFGGVCLFVLGLFIFSTKRYAVSADISNSFKHAYIHSIFSYSTHFYHLAGSLIQSKERKSSSKVLKSLEGFMR